MTDCVVGGSFAGPINSQVINNLELAKLQKTIYLWSNIG